jgi:MFS family permease
MLPQLEGKGLLFGTTASCGLGFMLFGTQSTKQSHPM